MRIRTIKPEFFAHDGLAELPPIVRLLFIGLWGLADRRGRLEDRAKRIKIAVLPYDSIDVDSALTKLHDAGFITRYKSGETGVIQVNAFEEHQRITGKEAETESKFSPPELLTQPGKQRGSIGETTETTEGKGREGKGKDSTRRVGEVAAASPENPETQSRQRQFSDAFKSLWEEQNGTEYPFSAQDGVQLATLLKRCPNLDLEQFTGGLKWCWEIAATVTRPPWEVSQTGTLAAFCAAWPKIIVCHNTYKPRK